MRTVLLSSLVALALAGGASAADLGYGYDSPLHPAPQRVDDDDDDFDRPHWRERRWREQEWRRPPPRVRIEEEDDDDDRPRCWVRRTPYGPERVCR